MADDIEADAGTTWPGSQWGMPSAGTGAVAGFGRRLVAIVIDWAICQLIAVVVLHGGAGASGGAQLWPLALFAVENLLLISATGATIGQRLLGMRVGSLGRPTLNPLQVLVRTALLCLFIPAIIIDRDQRGLHDRAGGTIVVRS